jgi:uncharacterized membrane protein
MKKTWHEQHQETLSKSDRVAAAITSFSGSMRFVYVHIVWWTFWFIVNSSLFHLTFDKYPYGLLTMILSLEAILLSTFIMIAQNQQNKQSEIQADHDRQVEANVLAEVENIKKINAKQNTILAEQDETLSKLSGMSEQIHENLMNRL